MCLLLYNERDCGCCWCCWLKLLPAACSCCCCDYNNDDDGNDITTRQRLKLKLKPTAASELSSVESTGGATVPPTSHREGETEKGRGRENENEIAKGNSSCCYCRQRLPLAPHSTDPSTSLPPSLRLSYSLSIVLSLCCALVVVNKPRELLAVLKCVDKAQGQDRVQLVCCFCYECLFIFHVQF